MPADLRALLRNQYTTSAIHGNRSIKTEFAIFVCLLLYDQPSCQVLMA